MEKIPEITRFQDGTGMWEKAFETFTAKVYLPDTDTPAASVRRT